jgi:hypothetical protein
VTASGLAINRALQPANEGVKPQRDASCAYHCTTRLDASAPEQRAEAKWKLVQEVHVRN